MSNHERGQAGSRVGEVCCNDERIERVLSAQQWRVVLALLDDNAMSADPILRREET